MWFVRAVDSFLPYLFEEIANPFLDSFMVFMSKLGDGGFIWIAAIVVMIISKRFRKFGIVAAISLILCYFTGNHIIKPLVGRIRPCNLYPGLRMLIERPADFSFPSMHTATSFSVATVIAYADKSVGSVAIILSVFIALSRVYLNVHFTTDIICGAAYGILITLLICFVIKKTKIKNLKY